MDKKTVRHKDWQSWPKTEYLLSDWLLYLFTNMGFQPILLLLNNCFNFFQMHLSFTSLTDTAFSLCAWLILCISIFCVPSFSIAWCCSCAAGAVVTVLPCCVFRPVCDDHADVWGVWGGASPGGGHEDTPAARPSGGRPALPPLLPVRRVLRSAPRSHVNGTSWGAAQPPETSQQHFCQNQYQ